MGEAVESGPGSLRQFWAGTHPATRGAGLALVGIALLFAGELVFDRIGPDGVAPDIAADIWIAISHIAVLAYLVAACGIAARTRERHHRALRDLGARVSDTASDRARRRRVLIGASVAGVIISALVSLASPDFTSFFRGVTPESFWHRVIAPFLGIYIARLVATVMLDSAEISTAADTVDRVDLLDLKPLGFFARHGQSNALLFLGLLSAYSLFLVDLRYLWIFGLLLAFAVPGTLVAFVLPLRGARRLLQRSKERELAFCRDRLRRARTAIEHGEAGAPPARLDELLAWEARIEAVREWPFDTGVLARLALYLLLPLGSWAGAALVERSIDALLD